MYYKKRKESLIIDFKDLVNRDVQKDDLSIEEDSDRTLLTYKDVISILENSFFSVVYNQAFEQISMIIKQSSNSKQHDIQNIIAFTGRRGTGKTSAMLSFANFINKFSIQFESNSLVTKCIHLPTIDASHLGENEDILSIVLTNIIDSLDDEIDDSQPYKEAYFETIKIFREKACELLKRYSDILKKEQFDFESSYHYTKGISEKIDIEDDFSKFISEYANFKLPNSNAFLVITIDDIDMAPKKHIDIMKCIHKYLMKHNIIVMITTELSFLIPEMQKTFYDNLCPMYDVQDREDRSMRQVQEFLKKMLPSDNRITMPSWKKKDYIEMFPIMIDFGNRKNLDKFDKNFPKLSESEFRKFMSKVSDDKSYMITPKQLILMMIANRTKVYLDVKGNKYHFMEPTSLRNMYDLFYLLYSMNNVVAEYDDRQKDNSLYYLHRSENRKRLLDYIHFTMRIDMRFNSEENRFIDALLAQPIERRGKMIWDRYYTILRSENYKKEIMAVYDQTFYEDELQRHQINNYSFGELLRILYTSTRIGIFDHKFVKFILASFSFSLPAFVENERYIVKFVDNKYSYDKMLDIFGYTLLGTWSQDLFCSSCSKKAMCCIEVDVLTLIDEKVTDENIISILIYLLLLSSYSDNNRTDENSIHTTLKKNGYTYSIFISLDPTAFFMNILLIYNRMNELLIINNDFDDNVNILSIKKMIKKIIKEKNNISLLGISSDDNLDDAFDYSFAKIVNKISNNYTKCHLSNIFKHIDLVYNVIKRAVSKRVYLNSTDLIKKKPVDNPPEVIKLFYLDIIDKLKENDDAYFSEVTSTSNNNPMFSYRFQQSPIVKFFLDEEGFCYDKVKNKGICLKCSAENRNIYIKGKKLKEIIGLFSPRNLEGKKYIEKIKLTLESYKCLDLLLNSKMLSSVVSAIVTNAPQNTRIYLSIDDCVTKAVDKIKSIIISSNKNSNKE